MHVRALIPTVRFLVSIYYKIMGLLVNDAGKELSDHPGRVSAFLDFLGVGDDDPRRGGSTLYSSHTFGEAPKKVRFVLCPPPPLLFFYNVIPCTLYPTSTAIWGVGVECTGAVSRGKEWHH